MPLRDRWAEYQATLPPSPYGRKTARRPNGFSKYPIFPTTPSVPGPTAPDESGLSDRAFKCAPPPYKPLGAAAGVYRYYRVDHMLIYVGYSTNPRSRHSQHQRNLNNSWWREVHHLAPIDWYPTIADAKAAETRAMETEHPLYNDSGIWAEHRYDPQGRCPCGSRIYRED